MPKLTTKQVQQEIESGVFWPVYWLHGRESMKSRELIKRLRAAIGAHALNDETLDAKETPTQAIIDAAQNLSWGGGPRFLVIREAHHLDSPDAIEALFGPASPKDTLVSICIFVADTLDQRRKMTKKLIEKAATVACEEVAENEREAWIEYLIKRHRIPPNLHLTQAHLVAHLRALDPWSLDIVDQELQKLETAQNDDVLIGQSDSAHGSSAFVEWFFRRKLDESLRCVSVFADTPEEAIPLAGLLAWNFRQLLIFKTDERQKTRSLKLDSFLMDRFQKWSKLWTLDELITAQHALSELDFDTKQTPKISLGLWAHWVHRFCPPQGHTTQANAPGFD